MATTVAGSAMAGGGGFVLKSVREGYLDEITVQTFSVQNEGDFCVFVNDFANGSSTYEMYALQIDDIRVEKFLRQQSLVFGKQLIVRSKVNRFNYHVFEYGPAE